MTNDIENIFKNRSDYFCRFRSIARFGNAFFLVSQRDKLGRVLWREIVPCQGYAHDQRVVQRAKADVRFSSLGHGSDKRILAEILRGNWLEARNSLALLHGFLIGRRCITRCRIFVDGDGHFLGAIAIRVDDASCRFDIGDSGQVTPRARFAGYFRKETFNHAYRYDYLARKRGIGRLRRTVGGRRRLSVGVQRESFNCDTEYCCEFCQP